MSETPRRDTRPAAHAAIDPDELVRELRRQISAVREQMEAHRETMLAAGLTGAAPREAPSWAPRHPADDGAVPLNS